MKPLTRSVAEGIRAGNVVVMLNLATAYPAEKFFRPIRASAVLAVCLLMLDPLHFKAAMQRIPNALTRQHELAFRLQSTTERRAHILAGTQPSRRLMTSASRASSAGLSRGTEATSLGWAARIR
jgi:hypothetical protein